MLKAQIEEGICKKMEGKMEGMWSMSTSCHTNALCQKNQKIKGSICEKCYAQTLMEMRKSLDLKGQRNEFLLNYNNFTINDIPNIQNQLFRFEAFGDVATGQQLDNYITMAIANPSSRFTLFTKNYKLILTRFRTAMSVCPSNMNVVVSSLFINKPIRAEVFYKKCLGFTEGQLKVFTVYDFDYLRKHPDVKINCGSRSCVTCRQCYQSNHIIYINEILKSVQEKTELMLEMRDPDKIDEVFDNITELGL